MSIQDTKRETLLSLSGITAKPDHTLGLADMKPSETATAELDRYEEQL
jgi:hypothetical protein